MTYVMEMSTDGDILNTQLNSKWGQVSQRYSWNQVRGTNLNIPNNSDIIVIAHGDAYEIGNMNRGSIDIRRIDSK